MPYGKGYPLGQRIAGTAYGTKAVPEKAHRLHLDRNGAFTPRFYEIRDALTDFFACAMSGLLR